MCAGTHCGAFEELNKLDMIFQASPPIFIQENASLLMGGLS